MPPRAVRVLVFSAAALFREGLCSLLDQSASVDRVTSAGDWDGVLLGIQPGDIDAVIIDRDCEMPESAVDDLFEIAPRLRIVLVSSQHNRLTVFMQPTAGDSYQPQLIAAVAQSVTS
jgi:DNA-binding NarL/FixJ family response regulator